MGVITAELETRPTAEGRWGAGGLLPRGTPRLVLRHTWCWPELSARSRGKWGHGVASASWKEAPVSRLSFPLEGRAQLGPRDQGNRRDEAQAQQEAHGPGGSVAPERTLGFRDTNNHRFSPQNLKIKIS